MLNRRIRELRSARGLTQAELAGALRLKDKSTVAHWERGSTSPRAELLPRLAHALGCTVAELYSEAVSA